jgi:hypothetical protein
MTQADIYYVIKLNEFKDFLSNRQLIELSMCSKMFRMSLSSDVFRSFNFECFARVMGYKNSVIKRGEVEFRAIESLLMGSKAIGNDENKLKSDDGDDSDASVQEIREYFNNNGGNMGVEESYESDESESQFSEAESSDSYRDFECVTSYTLNPFKPLTDAFLESKSKFQLDLNQFQYQLKKLNFFSVCNHSYLIHDLVNRLTGIKILSIRLSEICIDDFQHLLDSLPFLEDLDFHENVLITRRTDSYSYYINWPLNLKKLMLNKNKVGYINDTEEYFKDGLRESLNAEFVEFKLYPICFPNLKSLSLFEREWLDYHEISNSYYSFLKENTHVEELSIGYLLVKLELFEIIRKFSNLTKLKLSIPSFEGIRFFNSASQNIKFSDIKAPVLSSIKNLDITYHGDLSIFDYIPKHYPNVTNLFVDTMSENCTHLNVLISKLKNFKHLTSLKIKSYYSDKEVYELDFSGLKCLKSIEFIYYGNVNLRDFIWNVNSCPDLRIVKFSGSNINSDKLRTELSSNWDISHFPNKTSFYRKRK